MFFFFPDKIPDDVWLPELDERNTTGCFQWWKPNGGNGNISTEDGDLTFTCDRISMNFPCLCHQFLLQPRTQMFLPIFPSISHNFFHHFSRIASDLTPGAGLQRHRRHFGQHLRLGRGRGDDEDVPSMEIRKMTNWFGYGSIPIDTFLVGWTSIYQLFWGSLGTRVLTHPHLPTITITHHNPMSVDTGHKPTQSHRTRLRDCQSLTHKSRSEDHNIQ